MQLELAITLTVDQLVPTGGVDLGGAAVLDPARRRAALAQEIVTQTNKPTPAAAAILTELCLARMVVTEVYRDRQRRAPTF